MKMVTVQPSNVSTILSWTAQHTSLADSPVLS